MHILICRTWQTIQQFCFF